VGRGQDVAATFKRKKRHGEAPTVDSALALAAEVAADMAALVALRSHGRVALPMETLPDPPAAAAPAGAQGGGDPLSGPQAGPTPAQLMAERRRRLEAQQVQP
jgi:hypothetical protein